MTKATFVLSLALALSLTGCIQSAKEIGQNPKLSAVGEGLPVQDLNDTDQQYSSLANANSFSTWNSQSGSLFTDNRAIKRGDILTVLVSINDKAQLANESDSSRTVGRGLAGSGSYDVAGTGSSATAAGELDTTSKFNGTGGTTRSETIKFSVAAVVTRVLGNGSLLVRGSQEVRVNAELRILHVAGLVRPSDIGPDNTISYERIAEARVSYGGRGHITQVQRPPWGQQILNMVLPF